MSEEKLNKLEIALSSSNIEEVEGAIKEIARLQRLSKKTQEIVIQKHDEKTTYYFHPEKLTITINKYQDFIMSKSAKPHVHNVEIRKKSEDSYIEESYIIGGLELICLLEVLGVEYYEIAKKFLDRGRDKEVPPPSDEMHYWR